LAAQLSRISLDGPSNIVRTLRALVGLVLVLPTKAEPQSPWPRDTLHV